MNTVEENIENLKSFYQTLKSDFSNQKHDLYFLKDVANNLLLAVSNHKMDETISFRKHQQQELIKLLANIRNLINSIEKEIEIQTKEEYFQSSNNEI